MLLAYFSTNPRSIFLVDAIGALLSTLLLLVVGNFEHMFGVPKYVAYQLAAVTALFAIYSLITFFANPVNWRRYLRVIAVANLLYCCLTLGLLFFYFKKLTAPGIIYFSVEIVIILLLSRLELRLTGIRPGE